MDYRQELKDKKKIVIKIGTSTITYPETGNINLDIGRNVLGFSERPKEKAIRQACAAVGQGRLMMMYEKLFAEYSQLTAQVLLTKESITNEAC